MISPVSNSAPVQPVAQPTTAPAPVAKAPSSPADTVQISSAAKALLQETMETSVQTAKEASAGDAQAIRLQAKHAAPKVHTK